MRKYIRIYKHTSVNSVLVVAHLVLFTIVEEVGPIGVCLHEAELKQLSQTQLQDVKTYLPNNGEKESSFSE